ncbi:unnamed protein product [Withania somnifera]
MAYTLVPKLMIEAPTLHIQNSSSIQVDLQTGSSQSLLIKTPVIPLGHSFRGNFSSQSSLQRHGVFGSGKTGSILSCNYKQGSVCLDRVKEGTYVNLNRDVEKRSNEQQLKKLSSSLRLSVDGPLVENDETTNNKILRSFCSHGKLLEASRLVDLMARRNQLPDHPSCINLIRGLVNFGQTGKAANVLQTIVMSGGIPDIITYNMLISVVAFPMLSLIILYCVRCLTVVNMIKKFGFIRINQLREGCPPYMITRTILVELVCKHCGVIRAIEVMEDLAVEGCSADLVTYNSMVNFTCKQGNFEDSALLIYNLLSHGLEPNAVTYKTLLHSFSTYGCWDGVDEILSVMNESSHPPSVVTYNILINGLCKHGLLDRAIDFFTQMVSRNCSPDIITYNTLLRALCKEEMVDEAIQVVRCLIIDGLAKESFMEKAMELYHQMEKHGTCPDDVTYRCLIWGFCQADLIEEAVELLREMGNSRSRIRDNCYRFIIHRLCQNSKVDSAKQVLKMMISSCHKLKSSVYSNIIAGIAAAGMNEAATELREKLREWRILKE